MNERLPLFDHWWLAAVLRNWLCIALAGSFACWAENALAYAIAILVIGTRQHALVVLQHDGTHYHISRSKRLNNLAMDILTAWPLGFSSSGYRRYHFAHHRFLGREGDPELETYGRFPRKWSAQANVCRLLFSDLIGFGVGELLGLWSDIMRSRDPEARVERYIEIVGMLLWPAAMSALLVAFGDWGLFGRVAALWYVSLFTSFVAVFRLRAYTEHIGSEWTHRLQKPLLWQRLLYLPENTWLHWEHHTWPGIPLRRLKSRTIRLAMPARTAPIRDHVPSQPT